MIDNQKLWNECRSVLEESGYPTDHFKKCVLNLRNTLPEIITDNYLERYLAGE